MPIISTFFGIVVRVFHNDHNPPHFHAEYGGKKIVMEIKTGRVLSGKVPQRALKLIQEWRRLNVAAIERAWEQARHHQEPKKVTPLE